MEMAKRRVISRTIQVGAKTLNILFQSNNLHSQKWS